jgi:peptide/nickel transport system substrate-binding protein
MSAKLLSVFLGLSMLAAACGDDDDDGGGTATTESGGNTATTAGGEGQQGGELTLGAEQFPECLNPVTQCSNSSWMHWAVDAHVLPRLMELTPEGDFEPSPVLDGDPDLAGAGVDEGSSDPFTVTYHMNPDAVWDDGSPITCDDVNFSWQAQMNTTGVVSQVGYEKITSIEAGDSENDCVVTFSEPFADWQDIFGGNSQYVLKAAAFPDVQNFDIADQMNTELPFSGGPWKLESFDPSGSATLVRNDAYWDADRVPLLDQVNMVLQADSDTELNSLLAGEVAAIYPQPAPGIADTLDGGDSVDYQFGAGVTYEGLWFNQGSLKNPNTPLKDPAVREALLHAVNRDEILSEVITPSFPDTEVLNCGGWVPTVGDWCDQTDFADATFDAAAVDQILTDAGWAKGSDGIYAKDGQRLSLTWQTVAGNARREAIQQLVIPELADLGIEVTADNSDADTLFQTRLPQLDTEIALYAQVASPDPSVTTIFACENIPSEANEFSGQNTVGWCNEDATDLMHQSDQTPITEDRLDLIHQVGDAIRADAVWLPFYQLPLITAWDSSQVGGPVGETTNSSYGGFANMYDWFIPS